MEGCSLKYKALSTSLILERFRKQLSFMPPHLAGRNYSGIIPDDYDKLPNYDLIKDDYQLPLKHALGIVRRVAAKNYEQETKKILANQLCTDLKNILSVVSSFNPPDDDELKIIIQTIIYLEEYEQLIQIVNEYYTEYCEQIDDETVNPSLPFALDYEEIFISAGDAALLLKGDPSLAIEFYDLADCDWLRIRDTRFCVEKTSRVKFLEEWHTTNEMLFEIEYWLVEQDELHKVISDTSIVNQFVFIQQLISNPEHDYADLVASTDTFFIELENRIYEENTICNALRAYVLMAYAMRRMSLLDLLCSLYAEESSIKKSLINPVWDTLAISYDARLSEVQKYTRKVDRNIRNLDNILCLAKAASIASDIKEELKVKDTEQTVSYYTSLENFFYMLPAKCTDSENWGKLSIMNISYMNDPNEGKTIQKYLTGNQTIEMFQDRKVVTMPYVFMKCFTKQVDYLPMWEMYANHAEGCCIVLDWEKTTSNAHMPLYRVCYIRFNNKSNRKSINKTDNVLIANCHLIEKQLRLLRHIYENIKSEQAQIAFDMVLGDFKFLFKDSSYSYEQEMRILKSYSGPDERIQHTGGEYPKLFVYSDIPIHIKEIVLAPKFTNIAEKIPYIEEQVEKMCKEVGTEMPQITISNIEYR